MQVIYDAYHTHRAGEVNVGGEWSDGKMDLGKENIWITASIRTGS